MRRVPRVFRDSRIRESVIQILTNPIVGVLRLWLNLGVLALLSRTCQCLPSVECPNLIRQGGSYLLRAID